MSALFSFGLHMVEVKPDCYTDSTKNMYTHFNAKHTYQLTSGEKRINI